MDFGRKDIAVGPYTGKTWPVSEGRAEALGKILDEEQKALAKYEKLSDVPRKELGKLRRSKAEALIQFDNSPPDSFFEGKDYEVSVVEDALLFFTTYVGRV
jgi:hypothetical protein